LPSDVIAKLAEETGELARAIQIKNGKLPSKTQPDGEEIEECADVINCAIDAISQVNRDLSDQELLRRLIVATVKKNKKWASLINKV
jgi:NTP pyrophosphatase (non-canonical NTP hydrolase)